MAASKSLTQRKQLESVAISAGVAMSCHPHLGYSAVNGIMSLVKAAGSGFGVGLVGLFLVVLLVLHVLDFGFIIVEGDNLNLALLSDFKLLALEEAFWKECG